MEKSYDRINWEDLPSTNTPRNALFLNKMDKGIDDIDNAVVDVQNQIDQLVIDGDSSPAIAQALAGTGFSTLKQYREHNDGELAQTANQQHPVIIEKKNKFIGVGNNLIVNKGVVYDTLVDDFGDWTPVQNYGTLAYDNTISKEGFRSIRFNKNNLTSECSFKRAIRPITITADDIFGVWIYVDTTTLSHLNYVDFAFYNDSALSKGYEFQMSVYYLVEGWNFMKLKLSDATIIGTPNSYSFNTCRVRVLTQGNYAAEVYIGAIKLNEKCTPIILWNVDDSIMNFYDNGYPYMRDRGIKGTCFISNRSYRTRYDGVTQNAFMGDTEHNIMYDNGWDFGAHSKSHNDLVDLAASTSYADQFSDINYNHEFIISKGWGKRLLAFSAPNGKYNETTIQVLKDLNYKMLRTSRSGNIAMFDDESFLIPTKEIQNTTTLATFQSWVDRAINFGEVFSVFTHGVSVNNADIYSMEYSTFVSFIDYLKTKIDAGLIKAMTFSEFYYAALNREIKADGTYLQEKIEVGYDKPNNNTHGNMYIRRCN